MMTDIESGFFVLLLLLFMMILLWLMIFILLLLLMDGIDDDLDDDDDDDLSPFFRISSLISGCVFLFRPVSLICDFPSVCHWFIVYSSFFRCLLLLYSAHRLFNYL